jgi:hypothetical protein
VGEPTPSTFTPSYSTAVRLRREPPLRFAIAHRFFAASEILFRPSVLRPGPCPSPSGLPAPVSSGIAGAYVPFIDTTPNVADMSRHPVLARAPGASEGGVKRDRAEEQCEERATLSLAVSTEGVRGTP